ncbi:MAG: hypothetical protein JWN44_5877 [Myxococcales bacterium]|nr:hypothetical protein [Myxococcales bacterium]
MCAAQAMPVPRSAFERMLQSLLRHAFELLDEDSPVDRKTSIGVVTHALAAWQAYLTSAQPRVTAAAVGT